MLFWRCCSFLSHLSGTPTGIPLVVALLTNKYNGKGLKGLGLQGQTSMGQCYLGGAVHYWAILAVTLLTKKYDGKGQKGTSSQEQKPLGQCYLRSAVHNWAILAVTPTGILSVVPLLTNKYNGSMGQCYLDGAVHYWAILAVTPTGILSFVALLTNKYNGKGQKSLGLQGQKHLGQCVTAILAELFITGPSWWWSLLGFFLL